MPSPTTKLSLSKQTLIRLIVDHSRLHESIGTWAIGYDPTARGWRPVWLGRYPHPVEGYAELEAGWRSVPLPRIRGHKYTKRLGVSALGQHVQTALAEDALRHWLAAQRQSDAPYIELA